MKNLFDNPLLILVLVLLIVVIFGAKKLPDAARSLGRSMRIFKSEVKEMKEDGKDTSAEGTPAAPLEGRVVDGDRTSSTGSGSRASSYDARPTDGQRSGA